MNIKIYNEIGKLKKVLVHRPGKEVERQYPEIFEHTLFDDVMFTENAQKEHDVFTNKLKQNGVEVYYIEKLVSEIFDIKPELREKFLNQFIKEANIKNETLFQEIYIFFNKEKDNFKFVNNLIAGVIKSEITPKWDNSIESHVIREDSYPFYVDPIPNLLFQRDPIASIFDGMNIHSMTKAIRQREAIFYEYLLEYHSEWKNIQKHLNRDHEGQMEGGDILVINKNTLFVGVSERTTPKAIEQLSISLFKKYSNLKQILGIHIPKSHASMHLDTMITQMDYDKFSVDFEMAKKKYLTYCMTYENDKVKIETNRIDIESILKKYIHKNAKMFIVGNGNIVHAKAEQWNDGANCLALAPGKIFVYDRNIHTNDALEKAGITLFKIPSGELSRGRGGPRCMTMPLEREDI